MIVTVGVRANSGPGTERSDVRVSPSRGGVAPTAAGVTTALNVAQVLHSLALSVGEQKT